MAHRQTDIRNALVSLLTGTAPTYATNAQSRVYTNRVHNLPTNKLPAIIIHDGPEQAIPYGNHHTKFIRTWSVRIEVKIESSTNYETTLDDLTKQVEDLILANYTLGGITTKIIYTGADPTYETGEKTLGSKDINFDIQYIY